MSVVKKMDLNSKPGTVRMLWYFHSKRRIHISGVPRTKVFKNTDDSKLTGFV